MPRPQAKIRPRLRVEPSPTDFLRMARSCDFIANVLVATVGEEGLASLHGPKDGGERTGTLPAELRWMREFCYGLHVLSAEDIGMVPAPQPDEPVDRAACEAKATEWLESFRKDADQAVDTRISVPLYYETRSGRTRLWGTIGVRLARLDVSYARPPKIKPAQGAEEWQMVKPGQREGVQFVIAADEFAEVEIPGPQPLKWEEFRDVCDACKTKPEIVRAPGQGSPRERLTDLGEPGAGGVQATILAHSWAERAEPSGRSNPSGHESSAGEFPAGESRPFAVEWWAYW